MDNPVLISINLRGGKGHDPGEYFYFKDREFKNLKTFKRMPNRHDKHKKSEELLSLMMISRKVIFVQNQKWNRDLFEP